MNILLTKINSRYLGVSNGKHITNFVIYTKKEKKRGEKVVGLSKIGFFWGDQRSIKLLVSLSMVEIKNTFNLNL